MNNVPFDYNYINQFLSTTNPSGVKTQSPLTEYFRRYLFQEVLSNFKWEIPKLWSSNYFKYCLYGMGWISIIKTDAFGVIPQNSALVGYDVFYQPTHVKIANPALPGYPDQRIGTECALIKMQPDFHGVMDIVNHYAQLMAIACEAVSLNLFNTRLSYIFACQNDKQATSFKKMFDQLAAGEPAVFVDKSLFNDDGSVNWQAFDQNLSNNYIVDKLLIDLRKIENEFHTKIGIPNANTDKKERLLVDEINANNQETRSLANLWLETMQEGVEQANSLFGLNLSVKLNKPENNENMEADDVILEK